MTSTYAPNSGIELIGTGDQSGSWGDTTNLNLQIIDRLTNGVGAISLSGTTYTLTTSNAALSEGQYKVLVFGGSPSGTNTVTISPNTSQHMYVVKNNSGQSVIMTQGSGSTVTIANGASKLVYCNGAAATAAVTDITATFAMSNVSITGGSITGITDLAIADGGTGASTAGQALTNLGGAPLASPAFTGQASFADGSAAAPSIAHTGDLNAGLFFPAVDTVAVTTAGTEAMRINSSGNVGIGTTSPSAKLDVDGSVRIRAGGSLSFLNSDNTNNYYLQNNGVTGVANPALDIIQVGVGTRMRIDSSGNVGIGTTIPESKMQISTSDGTAPANTTGNNALRLTSTATAAVGAGPSILFEGETGNSTAQYGFAAIQGFKGSATAADYSGALAFYTQPSGGATSLTERMRINSSGNVGIGTGSPAYLLDVGTTAVNPAIRILGGNTVSADTRLILATAGNGGAGRGTAISILAGGSGAPVEVVKILGLQETTSATADNASFVVQVANTSGTLTERMRIDSSGNVGIGVTPNSAWSWGGRVIDGTNNMVISAGGNNLILAANTYWNGTAWVYKTTSQASYYTQLASQHQWFIAPSGTAGNAITFTQSMTFDASGNLGIGNTAPVAKLHVTGASITTGVVYKAQPAQTSKAAAATLTIAELLTGIVQYTGAVATLTLPTGTSIEGGLPATFPTDMSFDVSFINTGAALLTIGANGNTTVGTMTIATLTSGLFRFRKTAANTYTVYRIS